MRGTVATGVFGVPDDHVVISSEDIKFEHAAICDGIPDSSLLPLPLWIVGSNALLGDVRRLSYPLLYVRGSAPKACAALETTSQGCLYHSCQTGPTTSGAGLLYVDEQDRVHLIGVHNGAIASAISCEESAPTSLQLNVAAQF